MQGSKKYRHPKGPRPWSKLQREIYKLLSPELKLQIHCTAYRMASQSGSADLPRYWITLDKEVIWDYPKDFLPQPGPARTPYPYETDISAISALLREYIDTPKNVLPEKHFTDDAWGITDILKAADRRLGKEKLRVLRAGIENGAAIKVMNRRKTGMPAAEKRLEDADG